MEKEKEEMKSDKSTNYAYNKSLRPLANSLRKRMTKSEACLWKYALRARQIKGYSFRRQRPVLNYIADFMCKNLKLIIEVDGITHQNEAATVKDDRRTAELEQHGFRVIRFSDEDVLKNMQGVISHIEQVIEEIEHSTPLIPRRRGTSST